MDPLNLSARTTALVLIDMQKGILAAKTAPHSTGQIIGNAVSLAQSLHAAGGLLVRVHVGVASNFADAPAQPVDKPAEMPSEGLPPDFSEFAPEIAALPADVTILKRQWGAFYGTELDLQLRRRGVTTVILAGLTTSFGVETTVREGWQHNYAVVVAEDACTDTDASLHRSSVQNILPHIARVRQTREIIAALAH